MGTIQSTDSPHILYDEVIMPKYYNKVPFIKKTDADWTSLNPILMDGEIILVTGEDEIVRLKVGDGVSNYSDLDYISDEAKKINAVNTIVNKNGKLYGYNTDSLGFKEMHTGIGFNGTENPTYPEIVFFKRKTGRT